MKRNAIWLSRHEPTPDQISEINSLGFSLELRLDLGSRNLETDEDVSKLAADIKAANVHAAFGVFAVPLLGAAMDTSWAAVQRGDYSGGTTTLYGAWNVQRSPEGGKPTFHHKKFVVVGVL